MGDELIMRLAPGETKKAKALIAKLDGNVGVHGEKCLIGPGCAHKEGVNPDCWIEWKGSKVEIGYISMFGCSDWAKAIAKCIWKRFGVVKGGWASIGYCKDVNEFFKCSPFRPSIRASKRGFKEWRKIVAGAELADGKTVTQKQIDTWKKHYEDETKQYQEWKKIYQTEAERMFKKAEES